MSVKIIAQNVIAESDFNTATEQEGPHAGQPTPASANTGDFRLLSKGDHNGDIADFSYSGTATSDGAAGGTTVIDSVLAAFGDDYFIDATLAVTDFLQDTGDYTEQDAPGRVALTDANTVTVTDLDQDEECWLYIDKGAAHFDGDFEFHVDVKCTANAAAGDKCAVWALANGDAAGAANPDTLNDIDVGGEDFLAVYWKEDAGSDYLVAEECNAGALTSDTSIALVINTQYYLKITRDESVGANGTLYCYIYSDASHSTLVDTLTVTLTETEDFRYLYWMNSYEDGGAGRAWDGVISDFEIVSSESQTVTDFAQATGTLTTAAFSYQINAGASFTLTVPYSTRSIYVELTGAGDAGDGTFKFSHDGGTTYFGRDDPDQATWLAETTVTTDNDGDADDRVSVAELPNGTIGLVQYGAIPGGNEFWTSSDKALSWDNSGETLGTVGNGRLFYNKKTGRLLFYYGNNGIYLRYSDDYGSSWTYVDEIEADGLEPSAELLSNGNVILAYRRGAASNEIDCRISTDGGMSFSSAVEISAAANDQYWPSIRQAKNGDIICAYTTDEDAVGIFEIKCRISTDGGASWGSAIDIIDAGGGKEFYYPDLLVDIDGSILCFAEETVGNDLVVAKSTDHGATWAADKTVHAPANNCRGPSSVLVDGHDIIVAFQDDTDDDIKTVRRGMWELFASGTNDCPCAMDAMAQKLVCDFRLVWHGGAGDDGDVWTMEADYDYHMKNLIADSPSKPWRSETDNAACNIDMDASSGAYILGSGVAFFGSNVRTLTLYLDDDSAYGSPSTSESVSFDVPTDATGVIAAVSGEIVQVNAASNPLDNFKDHELAAGNRFFFRATSGTDSGITWEIVDNVGNYITLKDGETNNLAATDTFAIFQDHVAATFTFDYKRYGRVSIGAQQTADDYYQLGTMVLGQAITLTDEWAPGYGKPHVYDITRLRTPHGGIESIRGAERKRFFELVIPVSEGGRRELLATLDFLGGKALALIPDDSKLQDCYLVTIIGNAEQRHRKGSDIFDISVVFEEVL